MLSKREKVLVAVLGSLLLHGIILFLFGVTLRAKTLAVAATPAAPEPESIKLEIQHTEPPPLPVLPPPPPPPMIDNPDSNAPPPKDPAFESNINSVAASNLPATGDAPVPTQEGKPIPEFTFDTHQYTVGDKPAVNASAPAAPPVAEQQPPDQQQPPEPSPPPPKQETAPPRPKAVRAAPRQASTPAPTPELLVDREMNLFEMLGPTPTPHPPSAPEDNLFDPTRRDPQTEPPRPTPAVRRIAQTPTRPSNPGYQPMTQKAALSGSISNRGSASVAALGTPLGRYKKAISDAIGSRWYYYMGQRSDVASFGTVKIHFYIDRSGATLRPEVISNSGNSTLANVSLQAIAEATIPPMPPEVAALASDNQLDTEFSFSLIDF